MPAHTPDGDFYVSPVYLAGATFTGDPALQPLLDQGFHLHHDELAIMWNQICQGTMMFVPA
ncbi:hypothetical protein [Streptomyces natalensis]|uniref:Uncharacterized protein n=1 Tax=Streptomyces natalensis ATCC 27448 TaxID=1240678 RepID=A0A0D7CHQ3_9ACTN|nr:hypothetical protein [Streptomyces natalensis]KIZ14952.1 hypothetical protein SNA_29670 [Streptomyces natalensis ATCC 27448]